MIEMVQTSPLLDFDPLRKHINDRIEQRAQEMEAFILAHLRVTGLNPVDMCLVVEHGKDLMSQTFRLEHRPRW